MTKDTRIACRISEEEKQLLDKYCEEQDMPMSQVIRKAIKQFLISKNESKNQNENEN